jgi:hypothetical protein
VVNGSFLPSSFSFQHFSFWLPAGLFDAVFHPQLVEQGALGLLLAVRHFDQTPNEMGLRGRPAPFHF